MQNSAANPNSEMSGEGARTASCLNSQFCIDGPGQEKLSPRRKSEPDFFPERDLSWTKNLSTFYEIFFFETFLALYKQIKGEKT